MTVTDLAGQYRPQERAGHLGAALDVVRQLTPLAEREPLRTATVDELVYSAHFGRTSDLPVDEVLGLARYGHAAEIRLSNGGWTLLVRADGETRPSVEELGQPEDALNGADLAPMRAAVDNADATEALRIAGYVPALVHVTVRNQSDESGFHWIATMDDMAGLLEGPHWPRAIAGIAAGPTVLVVGDVGAELLTCRHLLVCGFEAECVPPPPAPPTPARGDGRTLPSPLVFAGSGTSSQTLGRLVPLLEGVVRTLTWFHLATAAEFRTGGELVLRLDGARTVEFNLLPSQAGGDPSRDVALYEWACASPDPAVRDAVVHAASLAILNAEDVATAAGPVLRTARSLYELTRRGAVAEALATRRSARHAALDAARSAAVTARSVASKAVERALIQMAAAVAVVLSNVSDIVGRTPALLLLALIVGLSAISLLVARRVEIPGATSALDAELADLDQYREALGEGDIVEIRKLQIIEEARAQLRTARKTATRVYSLVSIAIVVVGTLLVLPSATGDARPVPTETSVTDPSPAVP